MEQVLEAIAKYVLALHAHSLLVFADFVESDADTKMEAFRRLKNAGGVGSGPAGLTAEEELRFDLLDSLTIAIAELSSDDRTRLAQALRKLAADLARTDLAQAPDEEESEDTEGDAPEADTDNLRDITSGHPAEGEDIDQAQAG